MKNLIIILSFLLLVIACSSALDRPFNDETYFEDVEAVMNSLTQEDEELLLNYLMYNMLKEEDMSGKTYRDLLKEAKTKVKNEEKLSF
jgi:hypothetical protein